MKLRNTYKILKSLPALLLLIFFSQFVAAQAPTAEFAVDDTIVCVGNTVTFTDQSIQGSSAITSWSWNFGNSQTSTSQNPTHTYNSGGTYTVTLVVTDALLNTDTVTHQVYVLEAKASQNTVRICSPQSSTTITAQDVTIPGVTSNWFTASTGIIASPNNDTTLISNLISGMYIFYWVVSDGFCTDADQVTVIVDQPVTSNAGPDQSICTNPGSTTMAATAPATGTGVWSTTSSASITTPSNRNTTVTGLTTPGAYVFVWTVTNGSCVSRDTVIINAFDAVTPNAGPDQQVCTNTSPVTLTGSSPAPGTGNWTTTGSAAITTPNNATTTVTGLTAGTHTFIWSVTVGGCITRDTMRIIVDQLVTANAGNNLQVCTTTGTATLNGNNPAPGTGLWTALNGGTITSPASATTGVTGLNTAGFHNFVYTITNGTCVSRDTMTIIVRAPVTANAGIDQQVCNISTATLTGNSAAPGTGLWSTTGSATITSPNSASTSVSNLAYGINTFVYTTTYGACISRDTMTVRRDSLVTSNAGTDQTVCQSVSSVTLAGNNPAPATGLWTAINGGTITNPALFNSTVTGLTPGNHNFVWTITNGSCISRDTVRITVSVQIPANAGIDQQVCQGSTASLSGNLPTPGTGLWTTTSSATITSPSNPSTTITGLNTAGTFSFVWTVTNGACILRDTVRIIVDAAIASNAGPDQNLCASTTATLAGNAAAPGTGLWTTTGSASITTPSSANSGVTNLQNGNNIFIWTITNNSCIRRDTVIIRVDTVVTANAGIDQQLCLSNGTAILAAASALPGTGLWSTTSSATITNPVSSSSGVTGLNSAGTYNFIWTVTNGACISRDTMRIIINAPVTANAGSDQVLCSATTSTLNGSVGAPGTGLWTTTGSAIINSPSSANTNVSGLTQGNNTFIWTVTNGACIFSDTVIIHIDSLVIANAGIDQQICSGSPVVLSANSASPGSGQWTALNGGTITNPSSSGTSVTGLTPAGNYSFVWTITNGTCISRDTVLISISENIIADAGSDQHVCDSSIITLSGNTPSSGTGTWSALNGGSVTSVNNAGTTVTGLTSGVHSFVWTIVNGACTTSDTITITIDSLMISDAGADQQVCAVGNAVVLSASPFNGTWSTTSTAIISDPSAASTTVNNISAAGNYEFIWTVTNGICISTDTVIISADSLIAADAGADIRVCDSSTVTLNGNGPGTGSGTWTALNGGVITTPSSFNTTITGLSPGNYQFVWTITNGSCISSDTLNLVIDSIIVADAGSDQQLCSGTSAILNANDPAPATGIWTTTSPAVITDPLNNTTSVTAIDLAGNYEFTWTITNGSCISSDTVVITADSMVIADAGPDQFICETEDSLYLAAIPVTLGTGIWSTTSGAGIDNLLDPASLVTGFTLGTYQFVWTVTNNNCITSDTVEITITPQVTQAIAGADIITCSNDSVQLTANNPLVGTGTWSNTGSAGILNPNDTVTNAAGLIPGINEFIWTISNGGCVSTDTLIVFANPSPVADAGADIYTTAGVPVITGGTPSASAGTPPFTYSWTPGTLLDDSLVSNPVATVDSTQLFILTVTDSLGCTATDSIYVIINNIPVAVNDTVNACYGMTSIIPVLSNDTDADGDTLSVSVYQLPISGTVSVDAFQNLIYTPDSGFTGADSISYIVCDNRIPPGCDTAWVFINVFAIPQAATDITGVLCFGDSTGIIDLTPSGLAPFTFSWSNGVTTEDADSLAAGNYTVTITDSIGCSLVIHATVPGPADSLHAILNLQPVLCFGDSSGAIDLQVQGGTSPYTFTWSNGETTEDIDSLPSGTYTIIISDSNNCSVTITDSIVQPADSLSGFITGNDITCGGDSTGFFNLTINGGTSPYSYLWSNGDTAQNAASLPAGIYSVTISDAYGCAIELSDTLFDLNSPLVIDLNTSSPTCLANISGNASVNVSGGSMPYTVLWSTLDTTSSIDSLIAGAYTVTITDSTGCMSDSTFLLTDTSSISITPALTLICSNDSTSIALNSTVTTGIEWYHDTILMPHTNPNVYVNTAGMYYAVVNAWCGSYYSDTVNISVNAAPSVYAGVDMDVLCDSSFTLMASGALTYQWSPAQNFNDATSGTPTASFTNTTEVTLTGTDINGCISIDTVLITVHCDSISIPGGFSPNNDGKNDYFFIEHIDRYPGSKLLIFNRWGNLVYSKEAYDNSWNGFSNTQMLALGDLLPDGTYYYILDLGDNSEPYQGFVVLRR